MLPVSRGIHPSNAQPKAARSSFWRAVALWAMMMKRGRRLLAIVPDAARSGFLPRRSYVAPSPQCRSPAKRPEVELNPCPVYDFSLRGVFAKDLTPALFCALLLQPVL